jgi:hypothetical protein
MRSKYSKEEIEKAFDVVLDIIITNGLDNKYKRSFGWLVECLSVEQMITIAASKIHYNTKLFIANSKKLNDELALALYKNFNSFELQNNILLNKKVSLNVKKKLLDAKMMKHLEDVVSHGYSYFSFKAYELKDYPQDLLEIVKKRLNVKRIIK